jgi:hypothetical protein
MLVLPFALLGVLLGDLALAIQHCRAAPVNRWEAFLPLS